MNDWENISVRQGAQLPLAVEQGDPTSVSATIILRHQDSLEIIEQTENFVDGVANIVFDEVDTATLGVYDYQINENFSDTAPLKYPDPNACDGDCEFPTITICEALDGEQGSS